MRTNNKLLKGSLYHLFVILFSFVMLYPVLWMVASSFKDNTQIFNTASLIPKEFNFAGYVRGWMNGVGGVPFVEFFKNSLFYVIIATIGTVFSSAFVAYGFARIKFRGKGFWFGCMLLSMMLPFQVVMIPQFIIFFRIHWNNSFLPLLVPAFLSHPFFVFLMVQFIRGLPIELDESAKIDGCGRLRIFSKIIFPLITPAIITSTIFQFMWRMDDFLGPLLYLDKPRMYTISLAMRMFADPGTTTDYTAMFAMGTLSLIPTIIVFLAFQKYMVEGISTTGMKG